MAGVTGQHDGGREAAGLILVEDVAEPLLQLQGHGRRALDPEGRLLGNFVNRALVLTNKYFDGRVPKAGTLTDGDRETLAAIPALKASVESNLARILNIATIVLVLFFLWLLAAQVVIFSQGYELYHGTAGNMAGGSTGEADQAKDSGNKDIE